LLFKIPSKALPLETATFLKRVDKKLSICAVEIQIVIVKICLRKFCVIFWEFKGFALKNPSRGFAPAPHHF